MLKPRVFIAFLAIFVEYSEICAFNLSPVPNLEIKLPELPTGLPQTRSSYFGFSIVLRRNSIIIGAPRAQSTLESQSTINETGAIYRCPFDIRRMTQLNSVDTCEPYIFESSSNMYYTNHHLNEIRDYQWLGGSMDGGTKDEDPLLVCAPRFDGGERYQEKSHDYLHGICYSTTDTLDEIPTEVMKFKPFTLGYQVFDEVYYFQMGQLGFSAHITPNNREYIMGAPGVNNWSGTAVRFNTRQNYYDIPARISKKDLVLAGYAVASGYLDSLNRNRLYYVTTSPHDNMELGQAYIFQFDSDDDITIHATFKGTQYGEYFGYAALVCDINGDRLDDVLVSAPQYRIDGTVDIGAIYVFVNMGNLQFQRQIIKAPYANEARFGSTIMNLGDINRDGFNDIAVGAPLANGNGAVVIYLGNENGLETQPSQLIKLPITSTNRNGYFGHGLSKGVDIDANGYNDLAIGAPNNEKVYIYRSYPVIKISINITASEHRLDLQAKQIEYRICFHTDSDLIVNINLDLTADSKLKRIKFEDNDAHRLQVQVLAAQFVKCHSFNASILFLSRQVFVPIKTSVTHSLLNDGKHQVNPDFCTNCAVLDPRLPNTTFSVITYSHGCASEVCIVDLTIEAFGVPSQLVIGSSNILPIKYYITNKIEKAFAPQVTITNSHNLTLARTPSNCNEDPDRQIICDIATDQIFLEEFEYLDLEFDVSALVDREDLIIIATVTSMGKEQKPDDNRSEKKIKLISYSEIEIVGFPIEDSLIIGDDESTVEFEYVCKLQNLGPSPVKNVDFWFSVPIATNGGDSRPNDFIDRNHTALNITLENGEVAHPVFEMLPTGQTENHTESNVTYSLREHMRLPYNRTLFQYCNQSEMATCAKSLIKLPLLEASKSLTINLGATLKATAVRDMLENGRFLAIFVNVTAQLSPNRSRYLNITQLFSPIVVQKRTSAEAPIWVYVAAIVGGILLFMLLSWLLFKIGFFKRQTKDDMQQLLNEKLANEHMREETELNEGTSNDNFEDIDISRSDREV